MTAAISAALHGAENKITILEHSDKIGKKILATGNGKCNLTNAAMSEKYYRCRDSSAVKKVLSAFGFQETLAFFENLGLLFKNRDGYIYPYSGQACAVLDVLRLKCRALGITILTGCEVSEIKQTKDGFLLLFQNGKKRGKISGDRLIVAAGSCASNLPCADGSGYRLMEKMGYQICTPLPALTGLKCSDSFCKSLSGIRCDGKVSLYVNGKMQCEDTGELQLTAYGLSGIPVFQVSRYASIALHQGKKVTATVDFFPGMSDKELAQIFLRKKEMCPEKNLEEQCIGIFNQKLASVLVKQSEGNVNALIQKIKQMEFHVKGTNSFEQAQICTGGIDISQISFDTMESKLHKHLYFAGEIIDVDGMCGGYNLQWAWSTGYIAGRSSSC